MKQSLDQGGPKERTDAPNEASVKRHIAIERGKFKVCSGEYGSLGGNLSSGNAGGAVANILTYLDYNATTPLREEARSAAVSALAITGNPSSVHRFGRAARRLVENAREQVAGLVGAVPSQVVFTSGGTEANNLALRGSDRRAILVSAVEHDSVLQAAPDAIRIPVNSEGIVDPGVLDSLLGETKTPALVSVMLANNETGVIQPVEEICRIAHHHGALFHCDAVQGADKLAIDFVQLGADMMSLSAHKIGGMMGAGALIVADPIELAALNVGGGQERGRRGGTENVAGIAGFGAAAQAAGRLDEIERIAGHRERLEREALARVPSARIFGAGASRLANTVNIGIPGRSAETQIMSLDLAGIAVSAGSACSSGKVAPSHVLRAMGVGEDWAACAIRVSLGRETSEADIARFLDTWAALASPRMSAA